MTSKQLQFFVSPLLARSTDKALEEGRFTRNWNEEEELDAIMDKLESQQLSEQAALRQAKQLLARYPENLEIQNLVAARLWTLEMREDAAAVYEKAFQQAIALIPKAFKGVISWYETDNRSFLRVARGHLLGLMHLQDGKAADRLSKQLLAWCPSDNLGIRLVRGDILLMAGKRSQALKIYLEHADEAPESWYQAGKLMFDDADFVTACTYIRKGIADNPYIAEGLTGRTAIAEHLYWHGNSRLGVESALDYLNAAGQDWNSEEIDFVDWVFNSSAVLHERATIMGFRETLTTERDITRRSIAIDCHADFKEAINDELSRQLVQRHTNRFGIAIWPWDRQGAFER